MPLQTLPHNDIGRLKCLMVLWSVHMAVVRSWCEGAGGPASGFKLLLGRFVPVYCGAKAGFCGKYPSGSAAGCRTEDGGSNPPQQAS